jgi:hypothetical protein
MHKLFYPSHKILIISSFHHFIIHRFIIHFVICHKKSVGTDNHQNVSSYHTILLCFLSHSSECDITWILRSTIAQFNSLQVYGFIGVKSSTHIVLSTINLDHHRWIELFITLQILHRTTNYSPHINSSSHNNHLSCNKSHG